MRLFWKQWKPHKGKQEKCQRVLDTNESEYIKIEAHHEGLVTEELFREAQKAIRVCKKREAYHEEEKACQSKKVQILSAVSKMKERKRSLEIQAEHCKTNRLDLYYQWKDGLLRRNMQPGKVN